MKKILSIIPSAIAMTLIILLAVFTFLPVMTVHTDSEEDFMKEYTEGYFTKDAEVPSEIDLGMTQLIAAIPNISEISDVISIQFSHAFMESQIEGISKEISKISIDPEISWDQKEERIKDLREDIDEIRANFEAKIVKLGDSEIENIKNLLKEESFREQVATLYAVIGLLEWDHEAIANSNEIAKGKYPGEFPIAEMLAVAAFTIVIFLFAIIMSVVFTVKAIIRLVKFIIAIIKGNYRMTEKLTTAIPYSAFIAPVLLSYAAVYYFVGDSVSLGSAVIPFIITALAIGLVRIIDFCIFDCKSNMALINTVAKKALTLVTVILSIIFIFNFAGIGIYEEMTDTYEPFYEERFDALTEEYLEDGVDIEDIPDKAHSGVESAGRLIYGYLPLVGIVLAAVIAPAAIERFGTCVKKETKKKNDGASQIVVAVLTVAIAIIPVFFAAGSQTELKNCHSDGEFAVLYDEYLYEGTKEYGEYNTLKNNLELAKAELDEKKDTMSSEEIVKANQIIRSGEEKLSKMETTREDDANGCVTLAIFIVVIEVAYLIVSKLLGKLAENAPERKPSRKANKHASDSKKPAVTDAEDEEREEEEDIHDSEVREDEDCDTDIVTEEDSTDTEEEELPEEELVSDEEALTEETPDAEAPTEEAPTEEAPAEEAPAEEALTEETPDAEAPIEEAPDEESTDKKVN